MSSSAEQYLRENLGEAVMDAAREKTRKKLKKGALEGIKSAIKEQEAELKDMKTDKETYGPNAIKRFTALVKNLKKLEELIKSDKGVKANDFLWNKKNFDKIDLGYIPYSVEMWTNTFIGEK